MWETTPLKHAMTFGLILEHLDFPQKYDVYAVHTDKRGRANKQIRHNLTTGESELLCQKCHENHFKCVSKVLRKQK